MSSTSSAVMNRRVSRSVASGLGNTNGSFTGRNAIGGAGQRRDTPLSGRGRRGRTGDDRSPRGLDAREMLGRASPASGTPAPADTGAGFAPWRSTATRERVDPISGAQRLREALGHGLGRP